MRDGTEVEDQRLGRLVEFDERSREYPVRPLLAERGLDPHASHPRVRSYRWRVQEWHDQRREGACVLFSHAHRAVGRPRERLGELSYSRLIEQYHRAQAIDPWPETRPGGEGGTSVLAGAKIMQQDGFFEQYRWVFGDLRDAILTLGYLGGLNMGSWWWSGMWNTDSKGFMKPTGSRVGGHAWYTYGIVARDARNKAAWYIEDLDHDNTIMVNRNSWGKSWGGGTQAGEGDFLLTLRDWNKLRLDYGEAMYAVERGGYFGG